MTYTIAVTAAALFIAGCGGGGSALTPTPDPAPLAAPANQPPSVNAGPDQAVDEGVTVFLPRSGTDSDGTIVHFEWAQESGAAVDIVNPSQDDTNFIAPEVTATETLVFKLSARDDDGATASDTVSITVNDVTPPEPPTYAKEHVIGSHVDLVNGNFFNGGISPGDQLYLVGETRGPIKFRHLVGTAEEPITITTHPDANVPIEIDGIGKGFVFNILESEHVIVDGASIPSVPYGIRVTSSVPGVVVFVKIKELSRFITVRSVEIDGKRDSSGFYNGKIGIDVNDHQIYQEDHPGRWNEGHRIFDNYVHDVGTEGIYVGPNAIDIELRPRNIEVAYNIVERASYECVNVKGASAGTNSVHHNVCVGSGLDRPYRNLETSGINIANSEIRVFNNWIQESSGAGIKAWRDDYLRKLLTEIFNNIIVDAGEGIDNPHPWAMDITGHTLIYNNTIVDFAKAPGAEGVKVRIGTGAIYDNIIVGYGSDSVDPDGLTLANNLIGRIDEAMFADATNYDFHLTESSPARDAGSLTGYAGTDFDDKPRAEDGHADIGALEF